MRTDLILHDGFKVGSELANIIEDTKAKKWFVAILDGEQISANTIYYSTRTQCFNAIRTDSLVWVQERVGELLGTVNKEDTV